jgi:hypothetical protein
MQQRRELEEWMSMEYQKYIRNEDEWKKTQGQTTHMMDRPS